MRMMRPGIHFQLLDHGTPQSILGQHTTHRMQNHALRMLLKLILHDNALQTAQVAGVAIVLLRFQFTTRHLDSLSVDDDNKVAGVQMWTINGFVLAPQDSGDLSGQTPESSAFSIHDVSTPLDITRFDGVRFHLTKLLLPAGQERPSPLQTSNSSLWSDRGLDPVQRPLASDGHSDSAKQRNPVQ